MISFYIWDILILSSPVNNIYKYIYLFLYHSLCIVYIHYIASKNSSQLFLCTNPAKPAEKSSSKEREEEIMPLLDLLSWNDQLFKGSSEIFLMIVGTASK